MKTVRILPMDGFLPDFLQLATGVVNPDALTWQLKELDGMQRDDCPDLGDGVLIGDLIEIVSRSGDGVNLLWRQPRAYASCWAGTAWLTVEASAADRRYEFRNFDSSWWDISSNDELFVAALS